MKRILVMSDSHGNNYNLQKAVLKAGKIDAAFHAGDFETSPSNVEFATKVTTYLVRGNCDYNGDVLDRVIISIGGHNIYMTHGHKQNVNMGLDVLRYKALENGCDIAIYGHTHVPFLSEAEDVTIINPGSLSYPRQEGRKKTFAIIEIADDGKVSYTFDSID